MTDKPDKPSSGASGENSARGVGATMSATLDLGDDHNDELVLRLRNTVSNSQRLLVGVSGGLDSMVLVELLRRYAGHIEIAHVQHGLRGQDALADAQFVKDYADEHHIPYHEIDLSDQLDPSSAVQETARKLRTTYFCDVATRCNLEAVVLGHHADDQLETLLLNLGRGSGLMGLSGMQERRQLHCGIFMVRPLLQIPKRTIRSWALQHGVTWREDHSNLDVKYTRNAIRAELNAMHADDLEAFREAGLTLQRRLDVLRNAIRERVLGKKDLTDEEWGSIPSLLKGSVILEWLSSIEASLPRRRSVVNRVKSLFESDTGKRVELGSVTLIRERTRVCLLQSQSEQCDTESGSGDTPFFLPNPLLKDTIISILGGKLRFSEIEWSAALEDGMAPGVAYCDATSWSAATTNKTIMVRPWRPGDRFYPQGGPGSRKVKSFLTDQRVPSAAKRSVQVLTSNDQILWVVGFRIDQSLQVHPQSKKIIRIEWVPNSNG